MGQVSNGNKIQRILNLASWRYSSFLRKNVLKTEKNVREFFKMKFSFTYHKTKETCQIKLFLCFNFPNYCHVFALGMRELQTWIIPFLECLYFISIR